MSVSARLALVLGVVLLAAAAVLGFLPMSADTVNAQCGSAIVAKVGGEDVSAARKIADGLRSGIYSQLDDDTQADAAATVVGTVECADKIKDRRWWTAGVAVAALLVPAAIVFVGAGRRRA